ncbi:MAG: serine/threonine-protein kinase [Anaerolineae bacterium]
MADPGDTLLDRYELVRSLGRGGMAEVYLARDAHRGVELAIKVMREDLAFEPQFVSRFSREAQALARLEHPNIVRFYSFEADGPIAFIVMDYIRGATLLSRMRAAAGPLPLEEVGRTLQDIVPALHFAHRQGLVHRDIKPANIMVRPDGESILMDFGIAKAVESTTSTFLEAGTPAYMSPEQVLGHRPSHLSDIYSLGVLLYEMVTGRKPFLGDTGSADTLTRRIREEHLIAIPPDPRDFNPVLPDALAELVLAALAKQPERRWQDAASIVKAWTDGQERPATAAVHTRRHTTAVAAAEAARRPVDSKPSWRVADPQRLATLYDKSTLAFCDRRWSEARRLLSELVDVAPDYGDEGWKAQELFAQVNQELARRP